MRFREIKSGLEDKIFKVEEKVIGGLSRHKSGYPIVGLWRGTTQEKLAKKNNTNKWTYNIASLIVVNAGLVALFQGLSYLVNDVYEQGNATLYYFANAWTLKSLISNSARIGWMLVSRKPKGEFWLELANVGFLDGIAGVKYITQIKKRKSKRYEKYAGVEDYKMEEENPDNRKI